MATKHNPKTPTNPGYEQYDDKLTKIEREIILLRFQIGKAENLLHAQFKKRKLGIRYSPERQAGNAGPVPQLVKTPERKDPGSGGIEVERELKAWSKVQPANPANRA